MEGVKISKNDMIELISKAATVTGELISRIPSKLDSEAEYSVGYGFTFRKAITNFGLDDEELDIEAYGDDIDSDHTWEEEWGDENTTRDDFVIQAYGIEVFYNEVMKGFSYLKYTPEMLRDKLSMLSEGELAEYIGKEAKHDIITLDKSTKDAYYELYSKQKPIGIKAGQYSNMEFFVITYCYTTSAFIMCIRDVDDSIPLKQVVVPVVGLDKVTEDKIMVMDIVKLSDNKLGLVYTYGDENGLVNPKAYADTCMFIILNGDLKEGDTYNKVSLTEVVEHINGIVNSNS